MNIRRYLILCGILAGWQILCEGQTLPVGQASAGGQTQTSDGQASSGGQTQSSPGQTSQSTSNAGSGDDSSRIAPAPALSAVAGIGTEAGPDEMSSGLPQIPALLGGAGVSGAFLSEMERSNYLRGGVNVGAAYDTNPLLLSGDEVGSASVSVFPNISIQESTTRTRWTLGYAGGLTVNQRFTNQDEGSHNVNFDSQFRLSPHVNLRVAENFSLTTGFFDAGNDTAVIAVANGPNPSLISPLSTERSNLTTVETNYHFALDELVGASGSFYDLHFTNIPTGTPLTELTNSQTATGSAFWLRRIIGDDWVGLTYRFQRITFNPGGGETLVHSFLAVDTLNISKRFTLTGFVGPQYYENQGLIPGGLPVVATNNSNNWSLAGGAEVGWRNLRNNLSAGFSRIITDGGGVLGTVRLQTVHADFRRQLTPAWVAHVNAGYGKNQALLVPFAISATSIDLTSAGFSLERNLNKSFGLHFGYRHDFQQQFGVPGLVQTLDASRNLVFVTLSYQWLKPLGM